MRRRSFLLGLLVLTGCGAAPRTVAPSPARSGFTGRDIGCTGFVAGTRPGNIPVIQSVPAATAMAMQQLAEYEQAQQRWQAANIQSYHLAIDVRTFAEHRVRTVEVRNNVVVGGATTATSGQLLTVADLFTVVRREITDPCRLLQSVVYDPIYGFPTIIRSDGLAYASDFHFSYSVNSFVPLP